MNQFPGGDLSNRKLKEKNRLGPRPKKLFLAFNMVAVIKTSTRDLQENLCSFSRSYSKNNISIVTNCFK